MHNKKDFLSLSLSFVFMKNKAHTHCIPNIEHRWNKMPILLSQHTHNRLTITFPHFIRTRISLSRSLSISFSELSHFWLIDKNLILTYLTKRLIADKIRSDFQSYVIVIVIYEHILLHTNVEKLLLSFAVDCSLKWNQWESISFFKM